MKASEARERLKRLNQQKQDIELEKIYEIIKKSVDLGWHNTFISEFNISIEHKNILENDGYFVDTSYVKGFQVRWIETDMDYFSGVLVYSNKKHAKLKVDNNVIENYKRSACV